MDSPNRITNRNIGTQVTTGTFSGNPNSDPPQPHQEIAVSTPYAAVIDSRFITAALTAITTDRNTTVSSSMDSPTTIAISHGSRWFTRSANDTAPAFGPVRYALAGRCARTVLTSALVAGSCSPVVG